MKNKVYGDDKLPEKFYKYHSLNGSSALHLISTLLKKEVHFSSPRSFNDPFDCKPLYENNITHQSFLENYVRIAEPRMVYLKRDTLEKLAEQAWKNTPARFGDIDSLVLNIQREMAAKLENSAIYCVSERNDDILMWGHYADSHRGICLEFDSKSELLNLAMRVEYNETRPKIKIFDNTNAFEKMKKTLLAKSSHWAYEKEWRVVEVRSTPGLRKFNNGDLTGIIFGSAVSDSLQYTIKSIAERHPTKLTLYKAIPDEREFKMRIEEL